MTLLDRTATIPREASNHATQQAPAAPLGGSYITRAATTASSSEGTYVSTGSPLMPLRRGIYVTTFSPSRSSSPGRYTYSS
ncbi:hypothetical protein [Arthrobacter sp. H41]|uniref:hypothetical protein n=1 Tax=Arthrobacter sp. H41 TaxID=1312978 RepID=UPI00047C83E6|nr:hypothetical protein [Arthrobacter sp. H41]